MLTLRVYAAAPTVFSSCSPNFARRTNCPIPGFPTTSPPSTITLPRRSTVSDVADDLGALVEVVVRPRLLVRGRDQVPFLGVEDDDVRVGADRDRALARIEAEQLRRVGRRGARPCGSGRSGPRARRTGGSSCSRFSSPGPPFGIFEKSSRPSAFCSPHVKAQWSVEMTLRVSRRTASQSTSWFALSRGGGV